MNTFLERVENLIREMIREEIAIANKNGSFRISQKVLSATETKAAIDSASEKLLNAGEVAEILGVSRNRVYELARRPKANGFPVIVLGERQYRFSRVAVYEWLQGDLRFED